MGWRRSQKPEAGYGPAVDHDVTRAPGAIGLEGLLRTTTVMYTPSPSPYGFFPRDIWVEIGQRVSVRHARWLRQLNSSFNKLCLEILEKGKSDRLALFSHINFDAVGTAKSVSRVHPYSENTFIALEKEDLKKNEIVWFNLSTKQVEKRLPLTFSGVYASSMSTDANNAIFLSAWSDRSIWRISPSDHSYTLFATTSDQLHWTAAFCDRKDTVFTCGTGCHIFEGGNEKVLGVPQAPLGSCVGRDEVILSLTYDSVTVLTLKGEKLLSAKLQYEAIAWSMSFICADPYGFFYVAYRGGVSIFSKKGDLIRTLNIDPNFHARGISYHEEADCVLVCGSLNNIYILRLRQ